MDKTRTAAGGRQPSVAGAPTPAPGQAGPAIAIPARPERAGILGYEFLILYPGNMSEAAQDARPLAAAAAKAGAGGVQSIERAFDLLEMLADAGGALGLSELATENIALAAKAAAGIGAAVFIEPVSGPKPYPLRTAGDAVAVVHRARAAGAANVTFLCDLYHLATNGDDLDAVIAAHTDVTGHVQIADAPGRGEPGSGQLDLARYLRALQDHGYRGWVSLEYKPTTTTEASLAWLPRERRGAAAGKDQS